MLIRAEITGVQYSPQLISTLKLYPFADLATAMNNSSFRLQFDDGNIVAVSLWVSAKRTRSYPYARVYNTLGFSGKKLTIIPIWKDEGHKGDRDFLQWDTVSLMSLLGVYVIIAYYHDGTINPRYAGKITSQRFALDDIQRQIEALLSYQSDPLHWNLEQLQRIIELGEKALAAYRETSERLGISMHAERSALQWLERMQENVTRFMNESRRRSHEAQHREVLTIQPKEQVSGEKGAITIYNYIGGEYSFTVDEVFIQSNTLILQENKHTKQALLPSVDDIKDGLLKMILYSNIKTAYVDERPYPVRAVLKLTSAYPFDAAHLSTRMRRVYDTLQHEAHMNNFDIRFPESRGAAP